MGSDSNAIAKHKKRYDKWPPKRRLKEFRSSILNYLPSFLVFWLLTKFLNHSEYKLQRESIKFFELSNRAYASNKIRKVYRLLSISLNLVGFHISHSYVVLLRKAFESTLDNPKSRREQSEYVFLATQELKIGLLDATGWYQLSRGLFCLGYFRAAWVARENSLDLSIAEGSNSNSSPTSVSRAVEAHLERLDLDSARKTLSETNALGPKALNLLRESLRWFEGNVVENSAFRKSNYSEAEQLFQELVNGKSVVLVGPGSAHGEYGVEIDSADTVARIKYPGAEFLLDKRLFGNRCDISQYPGLGPLRELADISSYEFFDDLRLIVAGGSASLPVRNTPVFCEDQELPMYRTTITSGLRLLISLIRRSPSSLKIYGFNFYSEREPYNSGMKLFYVLFAWKIGDGYLLGKKTDYPKVEITSSFGAHDPVSNFCFAQNLYKAGLFDIEPYGMSILELTPYQYVERLEEMLGDW